MWAYSISLSFGLPTGKVRGGSDGSYQTGDGEFNQQLRFHLGKSYQLKKHLFMLKQVLELINVQKVFQMNFVPV